MALTPFDVYACEQVWKWEHPQHSFLHDVGEDLGEAVHAVLPIAEELLPVAEELL